MLSDAGFRMTSTSLCHKDFHTQRRYPSGDSYFLFVQACNTVIFSSFPSIYLQPLKVYKLGCLLHKLNAQHSVTVTIRSQEFIPIISNPTQQIKYKPIMAIYHFMSQRLSQTTKVSYYVYLSPA